jgi:hypothetical protein
LNTRARLAASQAGKRGWIWACATPIVAVLAALIPVIFNRRFYFYDDTQIGAYPIWFEIGEKLRAGEWPVFSATGWQAGNYAAEGQWGIFSPVTLLIGLATPLVGNAIIFSTLIKIGLLAVASVGIYLVSRSFGAHPPLAFVAGVASTLAGFTVYLDAPSWVTGLMVWAFLPFVWWSLRRMAYHGKSPLPVLVSGYLLVTVGYVHGTIMMVLLFVAFIAELAFRKDWKALLPTFFSGALLGLVALAVYLPGVLTLESTARKTVISNTNFLTVDLTGLAGSALPSNLPQVASWWWGPFAPVPLTYIAWFLPLFALVNFHRLRRLSPAMASVPVFLVLSLLLTLAPSDMGPLRTPVRLMPYVCLAVIVLLCVALSTARFQPISRNRWLAAAGVFVASAYLGWTGKPELWTVSARMVLIMAAGFAVIAVLLWKVRRSHAATGGIAAVMVATSLVLAFPQHHYFPAPPVQDFKMPGDITRYSSQLQGAKGQAIVVGAPSALDGAAWGETLAGNMWYLNPVPVHNLYSPIQNEAYSKDLCIISRGETCKELVTKLFEIDPATGKPLADLLRIDTVQVVREAADVQGAELDKVALPAGWSPTSRTANTVMWTRDVPLGEVGAPVHTSEGTDIALVDNSDSSVSFKVNTVPSDGGTVTLGRIAWPGYEADGAAIADPLRGYLLTVDVAPDMAGKTVTVAFRPPGWTFELAALATAILLGAAWSIFFAVRRQLARRSRATAEPAAGLPDEKDGGPDAPAPEGQATPAPHPVGLSAHSTVSAHSITARNEES